MAKFEEVFEDTLTLFNRHIEDSSIPRVVKIKILSNEGIKKGFGNVNKTQEFVKFMTDYDVIIQINEPIFDQLEDKQKEYVVKDLLGKVFYDVDKDKISILQHDITTFSGVLSKYDIDTYLSIKESIVTLLEQKQIQEDAKK
ncbi:MAG: hypothetical protein CMC98_03425 [Flavobacteriales bacterium]|jgi:hypothetical protein|nr:hypothetical protein [Flavobacteriales bacterium]|tara:strand:+ start:248 stop:673 length:426 start_codon:yes stop_codon:yes gene_type:complete